MRNRSIGESRWSDAMQIVSHGMAMPRGYGHFTSNSVKILWDTQEEFWAKVNRLRAAEIVSIEPDSPDETTTKHCSRVLYWYQV